MFAESIPMVEREYPVVQLQDEVLRRRLKKRPKVGTEISVDFAYVHAGIEMEEYERPISSSVCYPGPCIRDGSGYEDGESGGIRD